MGSLTKDWRRFVEAVRNLYSVIRSEDNGIEHVIKGLDNRISEAIMYFMKYGPTISEKVGSNDWSTVVNDLLCSIVDIVCANNNFQFNF